jgi:hypothetical protein
LRALGRGHPTSIFDNYFRTPLQHSYQFLLVVDVSTLVPQRNLLHQAVQYSSLLQNKQLLSRGGSKLLGTSHWISKVQHVILDSTRVVVVLAASQIVASKYLCADACF